MDKRRLRRALVLLRVLAGVLCAGVPTAHAVTINAQDFYALPGSLPAPGSGALDLVMFEHDSGAARNEATAGSVTFNGDDANTALPTGAGGSDDLSFAESYVTTAGKLQQFYDLNFGTGSVEQIALFLDLKEATGAGAVNTLGRLDIIENPAAVDGDPDPLGGDVSSLQQNSVRQGYSGGTLLAGLGSAVNLPVNGAGPDFADYVIFTGIDPFALDPSTVLLFDISMSHLSAGGESIFLSGKYAPPAALLPEPASISLLGMGLIGLAARRRRRRA